MWKCATSFWGGQDKPVMSRAQEEKLEVIPFLASNGVHWEGSLKPLREAGPTGALGQGGSLAVGYVFHLLRSKPPEAPAGSCRDSGETQGAVQLLGPLTRHHP